MKKRKCRVFFIFFFLFFIAQIELAFFPLSSEKKSCPDYCEMESPSAPDVDVDTHSTLNEQKKQARRQVSVTPDPIDAARLSSFVADESAGAIATFVGTTRDSFEGKRTLRLEYEAYEPMAFKALQVRGSRAGERDTENQAFEFFG